MSQMRQTSKRDKALGAALALLKALDFKRADITVDHMAAVFTFMELVEREGIKAADLTAPAPIVRMT